MGQIKLTPFSSLIAHKFITNPARAEGVSGGLLFASTQIEDFIGMGVCPVGFNNFDVSDFPYYMVDDDDSDHIVRMLIKIMRINDGVKPQNSSFGAENAGTDNIPGSSGGSGGWDANRGERSRISITPTNDDGITPGDNFVALVQRTPSVGGDNATGDLIWLPTSLNFS